MQGIFFFVSLCFEYLVIQEKKESENYENKVLRSVSIVLIAFMSSCAGIACSDTFLDGDF